MYKIIDYYRVSSLSLNDKKENEILETIFVKNGDSNFFSVPMNLVIARKILFEEKDERGSSGHQVEKRENLWIEKE